MNYHASQIETLPFTILLQLAGGQLANNLDSARLQFNLQELIQPIKSENTFPNLNWFRALGTREEDISGQTVNGAVLAPEPHHSVKFSGKHYRRHHILIPETESRFIYIFKPLHLRHVNAMLVLELGLVCCQIEGRH